MNTVQVQSAVVSRGLSRKGKNKYTQGSKRTLVATGYSDCSSFARWCHLCVTGVDIGGNTEAQVQSANLTTIHKGGSYPDPSKLQPGDLVYFGGNSSHYLGVGHVEVVIKVGQAASDCRTLGHGSGTGPTEKNLKRYCEQRGNYLMTRRPKKTEKTWSLGQRIISLGCYGEDVRDMQAGLLRLGFSLGTDGVDWDCGDVTDAAIRKFQKSYGLGVDGEFGPKSLARLNELLADLAATDPAGDASLSEDDYQDTEALPDAADPRGDPPTDTPTDNTITDTDEDDAAAEDADIASEDTGNADATMGSGALNPYPKPTKNKKKGSTGAAVKWIQWELRQSGYTQVKMSGKTKTLLVDGVFGPITDAGVRAFQKANRDADGKPLAVDGIVGPKTTAALAAMSGTDASGGTADGSGSTSSAQPAAGDKRACPDISYYDGKPDWAKVNVPHVWIREGDSLLKRDPEFLSNVKGATEYGIPWSAYLFFRAGTNEQAARQIDAFVGRVKSTGVTPAGYVLDVEVDSVTTGALTYAYNRLRSQLGADGPQVGIYIAHQLYSKFAGQVELFDYRWVPRYNNWETQPAHPYDVWQGGFCSFTGIRSGKAEVDCNKLKDGLTWAELLKKRAQK